MKKIVKGDQVQILLGKDRGKTGIIERVLTGKNKIAINGLNVYKRHVKKQGDIEGGILDLSKPMDISNVVLICPNCKKITRVGFKMEGSQKLRFCKKCKKVIGGKNVK
ncbi:MAG: 50S ribosomal protein L24 [Candidatus Daviesbacteria bacterium]|nr:MAG: 50S ribosomal protein L24 [Candidatus Daviesbacteria bacterium]